MSNTEDKTPLMTRLVEVFLRGDVALLPSCPKWWQSRPTIKKGGHGEGRDTARSVADGLDGGPADSSRTGEVDAEYGMWFTMGRLNPVLWLSFIVIGAHPRGNMP